MNYPNNDWTETTEVKYILHTYYGQVEYDTLKEARAECVKENKFYGMGMVTKVERRTLVLESIKHIQGRI